jgi:hypothetical protein
VSPRSERDAVASALADLVAEHDKRWSSLDFGAVAQLWEHDSPVPIYLGDEYAAPLVGADELDRHWARVSSRLKSASISSRLHAFDLVGDGVGDDAVARAVLLSRWRLTGRESDIERTGASWITWLLISRGQGFRIFHHMESQVYLAEEAQ